MSDVFTDEWEKLWVFLTKLKLYIEFNHKKFRFKMNKRLYIVFLLKNAVFNWVDLKLHEFLDKTIKKRNEDEELIFNNYEKFKKEFQWIFEIINEKWVTKQCIHILWQNESVIKYLTEFQWIVTLTEWNNKTFTLQYYWELKDTIKDEIVKMKRSENLQKMIDAFINIDSQQWKWWMKCIKYQSHQMWTASQKNWYWDDSMNLDMINRYKSILHRFENAFKEKNKAFWKKINVQSTENWKCYNCEVIRHLVRNCKKSHCERKELAAINKRVVHN